MSEIETLVRERLIHMAASNGDIHVTLSRPDWEYVETLADVSRERSKGAIRANELLAILTAPPVVAEVPDPPSEDDPADKAKQHGNKRRITT